MENLNNLLKNATVVVLLDLIKIIVPIFLAYFFGKQTSMRENTSKIKQLQMNQIYIPLYKLIQNHPPKNTMSPDNIAILSSIMSSLTRTYLEYINPDLVKAIHHFSEAWDKEDTQKAYREICR